MFNWSLSNNLTKWGGSPFCWLLQTVEKLLREPAWVAAGLSTNTQSQCQIQTQICKQVNSVADCRLWRNRLCGYNWRPCQPASSNSSSDLSLFLYTIRIAQLGPYYIQLVPLKYFERKKKRKSSVVSGQEKLFIHSSCISVMSQKNGSLLTISFCLFSSIFCKIRKGTLQLPTRPGHVCFSWIF